MEERKEIEKAISELENQREKLGDAAIDAALVGLNQRLSELDRLGRQDQPIVPASIKPGERRVVTALFCDVVSSTALAETMDPEAWTEIMNAAFEYLSQPVEHHGGIVTRLMGDAILAIFGAPTAHEDDPQRAVLTGLGMVNNIAPLHDKLLHEKGFNFNVRVGINTGLVFAGEVGAQSSAEYTAMGDAVNVAARMEQTAAPGTVQITQDTYTLVAPIFECKALGGITVKGKSKPVQAYQVIGRKTEPGQLRGLGDLGISSPLVGRENEYAAAQGAITRLLRGEGGILAILGEAGVGKSRLMIELQRAFADRSRQAQQPGRTSQAILWLEGQTQSYGQTISYWPFQQILRQYAGINDEDSEEVASRKLEDRIRELFSNEAVEIFPYLASLLAIEVTEEYVERVKYLDSEGLGRQVFRACRRFFERLADEQSLVLIFDDLHWTDTSSASLLEHLLPLTERVPLLLCGLSRLDPETLGIRLFETARSQYEDRLTVIELAPLSPDDSSHLVQNLLEIDDLPDHVRQMMIDKADGNPLFLEEIIRELVDKGGLVKEISTGRWRANQQIEKINVPDTIQGLLIARIDRLDDHLKRLVRQAAVIGRSFLFRILNAVMREDSNLEQGLNQLQIIGMIQQKQRIPELEYIFKHALVREAAYDSILIQKRREVHARVGTAIETLMADRLEEFYGLLAYHYASAEQWEKAQEYLFKAGDQAGRMAADAEALAYYHQAMDTYTRVRGEELGPVNRAKMERKIGEALYRLGKHAQARLYLERSLKLLGEALPSSRWGTRVAIAYELLIQVGHWMLPRIFVRSMGNTLDPVAEEVFEISRALSGVEFLSNVERFLLLSVKTLNICERRGYPYGSAILTANMGGAAALIGRFGLAQQYFHRSKAYAALTNPYHPVPELEVSLGGYYNLLADLDMMREHALKGMKIAQNAGLLRQWGISKANLAWSYWGHAEYDRAARECEELLTAADDSSDQQLIAWGLLAYGCVHLRRGQLNDAIESFRRGIEIAKKLPDYVTLTGLGGWIGQSYLALGEVDRSIELMETTEQLIRDQIGNLPGYVYIGNSLAKSYLTKAEMSIGKDRLAWLKKTPLILRRSLKDARRNRMALPDAQMLQGRYEWLRGRPEKAKKWWGDALTQAKASGLRYQEGVIYLETGRRLDNCEHLQQAEVILEEIGAEFDLAMVREALGIHRKNRSSINQID